MASTNRIRAKLLARVAAPIFFAAALSACSSVPDWVDPTTWVGGDSQASSDQTSDTGAGTDQSADAGTGQSGAAGQDAAAQPSDGQAPDIAAIPPKPTPPSTPDEQKKVADSLAADRAQAHYSADALRGGTEAAAPPPSAEPAAQGAQTPDAAAPNQPAEAEASASDNQAPSSSTADAAPSAGDEQTASSAPAAPAPETASSSAPAPNRVASADTASTSAPAAAPMAAETGAPAAAAAPDMQATFAPSKAPALDPAVSQFVPQQIISRYQETATAASVPAAESGTTAKRRHRKKAKASQIVTPVHYASAASHKRMAMIPASYSPDDNDGDLNNAVLTQSQPASDGALFAPAKKAALAVVNFPRETTILDGKARNRIQSAAKDFAARGGSGFMRVVGHASDPANNLPRAIRLRNNFERSEAQATAVARELIRDGVPAQKVLVEAVGDRPGSGRTAARMSRSAEIFLQS